MSTRFGTECDESNIIIRMLQAERNAKQLQDNSKLIEMLKEERRKSDIKSDVIEKYAQHMREMEATQHEQQMRILIGTLLMYMQ